MRDDAVRKTVEAIPAFKDSNDSPLAEFVGEIDDNARHCGKTSRGNVELPEDVVPHSVKAGADQNKVRLERTGRRYQLRFEGIEKLRVAGAHRHRHIELRADGFACTGFSRAAGSGIRAVVVGIEDKNVLVFVEGVLRAVAMVLVPILEQHTFHSMHLLGIARGNRNVVVDAEAHAS
mgnify:CR=1 FL=1